MIDAPMFAAKRRGIRLDDVWRRDRAVCARCSLDTDKLRARIMNFSKHERDPARRLLGFREGSGAMWDADHVIPLVEGGTNDLENIRTLCVPCHKIETALLATRRASKAIPRKLTRETKGDARRKLERERRRRYSKSQRVRAKAWKKWLTEQLREGKSTPEGR